MQSFYVQGDNNLITLVDTTREYYQKDNIVGYHLKMCHINCSMPMALTRECHCNVVTSATSHEDVSTEK